MVSDSSVPLLVPTTALNLLERYPETLWAWMLLLVVLVLAVAGLGIAALYRRRVERRLRQSEQRLELALEAGRIGLWDWDISAGKAFFTEGWLTGLGYEPGEIDPRPESWYALLHPDDQPRVLEGLRAHLDGHTESYESEHRVRARDGEYIWVLDRGRVVERDREGVPLRAVGTHLDITARKQFEQVVAQSEAKYETVFRASPDAITLTTVADGRIVEVNEGFLEMTGWHQDEVIGRTTLDIHWWHRADDRVRLMDALSLHGRVRNWEWDMRMRDGEVRRAQSSAALIHIEGEPYLIGVTRDVTDAQRAEEERRRLEAQLRQSQKLEAIGRLAGGIAHDFNNVLTAILGSAELGLYELRGAQPRAERVIEDLDQIEQSAQRASSLTHQLLAFSRQQPVAPELVDIRDVLRAMEKMLQRLLGTDIRLDLQLDEKSTPVVIDRGSLEQVVMNLAINARDAMPGGGRLTIAVGRCESTTPGAEPVTHVCLRVEDTGCGMDAATRERIFEPFFTTKPSGVGTGLGLATAYGIVRQAGGDIDVSSAPNEGTVFTVLLPLASPAEVKQDGPSARPLDPGLGAETVLICEDDDAVRSLTMRMLRSGGYDVLETAHAEEALSLVRRADLPIHLLLTDVIMPDVDGRELARKARELRSGLRVLFISGYTANVVAERGIIDREAELLVKPFARHDLLTRVRSVLDRG
jgi:PAS domain S-box-containing protein